MTGQHIERKESKPPFLDEEDVVYFKEKAQRNGVGIHGINNSEDQRSILVTNLLDPVVVVNCNDISTLNDFIKTVLKNMEYGVDKIKSDSYTVGIVDLWQGLKHTNTSLAILNFDELNGVAQNAIFQMIHGVSDKLTTRPEIMFAYCASDSENINYPCKNTIPQIRIND